MPMPELTLFVSHPVPASVGDAQDEKASGRGKHYFGFGLRSLSLLFSFLLCM